MMHGTELCITTAHPVYSNTNTIASNLTILKKSKPYYSIKQTKYKTKNEQTNKNTYQKKSTK